LLLAQTTLIAAHRQDVHRRLGVLGAIVAAGVAAISLFLVLGLPARAKAGVFFGETTIDPVTVRFIVWTDLAALAIFVLYVVMALLMRRRSDVHKRLLLLASIAILGPAAARVGLLLSTHTTLPAWVEALVQVFFFIGLPLTLVFYDLRSSRRVHRTTIVGIVGLLASTAVGIAIALSPAGASLISALE
jgi:hypothetical protein